MSGNRYLLDTNAIVALLQGNAQLIQSLQNSSWIGVSVISQIEFLAFSGLSQADRQLFGQFLQRVEVVGLAADDTQLRNGRSDRLLVFFSLSCYAFKLG
ncbi:MAG: twitching motility protein PilT [Coleofasciculus sp. S288]|nr:twitching motility protein PilT [Coleofasciculus sp. S288]